MKEILIFAGTTEGRKLSERLSGAGVLHTVCVATEYGEIVLKEHPLAKVRRGRMDREQMRAYMEDGDFAAVVDATHPYAEEVTENIRAAVSGLSVPYLRLKRENDAEADEGKARYFTSHEACAKALEETKGNILLTTGSKELAVYCSSEEVKSRLYARVLPGMESLALCMEQGICGKQILALQGPFTTELNEAMLRQYRIGCLVTKKSGRSGGYREKLEAAKRLDIPVFVVGQAKEEEGDSFGEVCRKLETICGQRIVPESRFDIILAGAGMGHKDALTREVYEAIVSADILLGAKRLTQAYQSGVYQSKAYCPGEVQSGACRPGEVQSGAERKDFYSADTIIPYLEELQESDRMPGEKKVVILFSGDSGFYSGCRSVYRALRAEVEAGRLKASITIKPGISSVAYLAACIGESYEDAAICSVHGKELPNLAKRIRQEKKTFLLTAGVKDMNRLGRLLTDAGLRDCKIWTGCQLSYPEQKVLCLSPEECLGLKEEGLYTCCILNPCADPGRLTHGRADSEFIREKTPMTKEEVREVSICKLKLHRDAVVYDIGSGTGSVAVETAALSDEIRVYAVEKKDEAVSLIEKNKEKFRLENIKIIKGEAPEAFAGLPAPTHAFIGGSGGNMQEILTALYGLNPEMRVVINAVTLETICEIKETLSRYPMKRAEIVQMQVGRARNAGTYHLMQAENPVWICAFDFCKEVTDEA